MQNKSFQEVAARYGLSSATQVKQRILWNNIKAIITHLYDGPENAVLLTKYEDEWRLAEKEEITKGP